MRAAHPELRVLLSRRSRGTHHGRDGGLDGHAQAREHGGDGRVERAQAAQVHLDLQVRLFEAAVAARVVAPPLVRVLQDPIRRGHLCIPQGGICILR